MYSLWFPLVWVTADTRHVEISTPTFTRHIRDQHLERQPSFYSLMNYDKFCSTKCYLLLVCMYKTFRVGLIVKGIKNPYRSVTFLLASYPYHHLARTSTSRTFKMLYMVFNFCIGFSNL